MDISKVDNQKTEDQVTGRSPLQAAAAIARAWAESGCRLTPQRQMVLKVLCSAMDRYHACEAVCRMVKAEYPRIGRVTVYRTLALLEKANLVSVMAGTDRNKRYRLKWPGEPRQLIIVCVRCGCFRSCGDSMDQIVKALSEKGFAVEEARLYGICPECSGELSGEGLVSQ
jgi:Fe2+ or Zn2+ uptake regulation protein